MITVLIPKFALEGIAASIDAWVKALRLGTLQAEIGALKGPLIPMGQGVYYDREALIDEHAVWETVGDGEGAYTKRKVIQDLNDKGVIIREEVVFKDPRAFAKAMRDFLKEEVPVALPYLMKDEWITKSVAQLAKDQMGLAAVDFGALQYVRQEFAKLQKSTEE